MEKVNIFEREVSWFVNKKSSKTKGVASIARLLKSKNAKTRSLIEEYRKTGYKKIKDFLPCYTVSGTFDTRSEKEIISHSNIVCIDIDEKDNLDVDNFSKIKQLIDQIPYVAYCGLSCGGKGYFVLIPIKQANKHREHYESICNDFERCGVTVDKQCSDPTRLRFASLDEAPYCNYEAVVYTRLKERESKVYENKVKSPHSFLPQNFSNNTEQKVQEVIRIINQRGIDITENYKQWVEIGAAIANEFGEGGRSYFHEVSRYFNAYYPLNADYQYTQCMKMTNFTIGTFFYYAKKYGINV